MLLTHQIDLLNIQIISVSGDIGYVRWLHDPSCYPPSHTVYLEIVATNDNVSQQSVYLHDSGDTADLTVNIPGSTTTMTIVRGSGVDLTMDEYHLNVGHTDITINAVRLIVEQDTGTKPLITTELVHEIGAYETGLWDIPQYLVEPKFFELIKKRFGEAELTYMIDVIYQIDNDHYPGNISIYRDDPPGTYASWAWIVTIDNLADSESWAMLNSAIDPNRIDQVGEFQHFRLGCGTGESMSGRHIDIAACRFRVRVMPKVHLQAFNTDLGRVIYGGDGEGSSEARAQSFKPTITGDLWCAAFWMGPTGTPTDALQATLTSTLGGAALATSNLWSPQYYIDGITTSEGVYCHFYFDTPYEVQADTTYYLELERTGIRDVSNAFGANDTGSNQIANGKLFTRNTGVWDAGIDNDLACFISIGEVIEKLAMEALIINEATTGTGEGEYQVRWDPSMFSIEAGTVKAIPSIDVSADASNARLRDQSGPTNLEGSDILGEENAADRNICSVYPTGKIAQPSSDTDIYDGGTYEGVSNSFVADGGEIFSVTLAMSKTGTPGTGYVRLYAVDGSNLPTGSPLAEVAIVAGDITTEMWQYFEFDTPYETTDGTTYCIAVVHEEGGASDYYSVYLYATGRGQGGTFNGSSWSTATDEYCFRPIEAVDMPGTAQDIDTEVVAA